MEVSDINVRRQLKEIKLKMDKIQSHNGNRLESRKMIWKACYSGLANDKFNTRAVVQCLYPDVMTMKTNQ